MDKIKKRKLQQATLPKPGQTLSERIAKCLEGIEEETPFAAAFKAATNKN